jgi:hypothetical protein
MNYYTNLPPKIAEGSDATTLQAFDSYYTTPLEVPVATFDSIKGYFESKGFAKISADAIAIVIIRQSKADNVNPMAMLDTLKGLNSVELSNVVSEILNYNRFKTSYLGYAPQATSTAEVVRNVVAQPPLIKSYSVNASYNTVNEGENITFTINTTNVKNGTVLYWTTTGSTINSSDIQFGITSGSVTINNNTAQVQLNILVDQLTETSEILVFNLKINSLNGPTVTSTSVTVNNTSFAFIADYMVIEYTFNSGTDLDTRTRIVSPTVGSYIGWGWPETNPNILLWGGDNTGRGTETALIRINNLRIIYPDTTDIKIDCRAVWYYEVGTDPVSLKITLYSGGAPVRNGFNWINPTATASAVLDFNFKAISLQSQAQEGIGERIAVLNYNVTTGQGYLDTTDNTVY